MTNFKISNATSNDIPSIIALLRDDPQGKIRETVRDIEFDGYATAFDKMSNDPQCHLIVVKHDDSVIGCLQLNIIAGLSYRGAMRALVEDVRIAKTFRNAGLGTMLLEHAENLARESGCQFIELFAHSHRKDAHKFYERIGYAGAHLGFRKPLDNSR